MAARGGVEVHIGAAGTIGAATTVTRSIAADPDRSKIVPTQLWREDRRGGYAGKGEAWDRVRRPPGTRFGPCEARLGEPRAFTARAWDVFDLRSLNQSSEIPESPRVLLFTLDE